MNRGVLTVYVAGLSVLFAGSALAADAAKGKEVFDASKPACKMCHTDAKHPLKAVAGSKPEELKAWVRTPKDMLAKAGKTGTMPAYGADKISDGDLDNLVAYIASLK